MDKIFQYPDKEFTLSELAKEAKVAKQNMKKILSELNNAKIIETSRLGKKIWQIKGRQEEWKFIRHKIAYNLNFIYKSNLINVLDEVFDRPKSIILFGSFRYGKDISISDIDIAIETSHVNKYSIIKSEDKIFNNRQKELLKKIEYEIERKFEFHLFPKVRLSDKEFRETFISILNGLIISGFLDIRDETRKN
ncbi:nucleotidyltransferase domain-containing protein [Candidatus Pacearchaeota archaeon]|nr:nucleotidyltransferase domain-containing protein [Candidatus Pacearchaeota archaeon]